MDQQSKANNPALKQQIEAQVAHLKADLTGLKDRAQRVTQLATGFVHEAESAKTAATSAINAAHLHLQAFEEKVAEFLEGLV